jgi:hypothetical protein
LRVLLFRNPTSRRPEEHGMESARRVVCARANTENSRIGRDLLSARHAALGPKIVVAALSVRDLRLVQALKVLTRVFSHALTRMLAVEPSIRSATVFLCENTPSVTKTRKVQGRSGALLARWWALKGNGRAT